MNITLVTHNQQLLHFSFDIFCLYVSFIRVQTTASEPDQDHENVNGKPASVTELLATAKTRGVDVDVSVQYELVSLVGCLTWMYVVKN